MNKFQSGERVCFVGDSITHKGMFIKQILAYYRKYLPEVKVEFYDCGIAGGNLGNTIKVFEEDIAIYDPTHIVLMIGVNDSRRNRLENESSDEKYEKILEAYERYKSRVEENKDKECDEYSDSVYENATVRKTDKGTSINMSFTPQQFKEYFAGMYETIAEMFSLDGMEDYMTLSDAGLKVVIGKEGYVIEEAVSFKITISDGTESVILEISNKGTYKSFNEPVTITPPQGYLSFTEKMDGDII